MYIRLCSSSSLKFAVIGNNCKSRSINCAENLWPLLTLTVAWYVDDIRYEPLPPDYAVPHPVSLLAILIYFLLSTDYSTFDHSTTGTIYPTYPFLLSFMPCSWLAYNVLVVLILTCNSFRNVLSTIKFSCAIFRWFGSSFGYCTITHL